MIAKNNAASLWVAKAGEPVPRSGKLCRQAEVAEIAGDGDMIRRAVLQLAAQRGKQAVILPVAALALPAQPAEELFGTELA